MRWDVGDALSTSVADAVKELAHLAEHVLTLIGYFLLQFPAQEPAHRLEGQFEHKRYDSGGYRHQGLNGGHQAPELTETQRAAVPAAKHSAESVEQTDHAVCVRQRPGNSPALGHAGLVEELLQPTFIELQKVPDRIEHEHVRPNRSIGLHDGRPEFSRYRTGGWNEFQMNTEDLEQGRLPMRMQVDVSLCFCCLLTRVKSIHIGNSGIAMRPSKNPELIEALALEVKVRRDELGLSQEDLAGKMQMDRPYISMIEVARKQPTLSVLFRLAQGLDMTLASLMERVEKRYVRVQKARRAAAKQTSS